MADCVVTAERYYTTAELAALGLPGLPRTKQGVNKLATRESWPARDRQGRGGGREYPASALPEVARVALGKRRVSEARAVTAVDAAPPLVAVDPGRLTDAARATMAARAALLTEVDRLRAEGGLSARQAVLVLVEHAQAGTLRPDLAALAPAANARGGKVGARTLSYRTLYRWLAERDAGGIAALAPAAPAPPEWPDWAGTLLDLYRRPQKPAIAAALSLWPEGAGPAPSYDQARRFIGGLGALARNAGRMGPRELKSLRAHRVRTFEHLLPGDVWTADGHCLDREVMHPLTGKPARPEVVSIVDVSTRLWVGWSAWLDEAAWLVAAALRVATLAYGVPAIWYVDNGCGFRNRAHAAPVTGLLGRLGVTPKHSIPYNSQARGVIERFHKTALVAPAKESMAYMGVDMDRQARQLAYKTSRRDLRLYGSSPIVQPWDEFVGWVDEMQVRYNARPHSSLPKVRDPETGKVRHQTPAEAWAAKTVEAEAQGVAPTRVDEAEARDLFRPHEERTVRRATVSLGGATYYSRVLEECDLHGVRVQVCYDAHDLGRVWVRDLEGRLICEAIRDGNATPYQQDEDVALARATRATAVDLRARRGEDALPALIAEPTVVPLVSAETARALADLRAEMAAPEIAAGVPATPKERYRKCLMITAAHAGGRPVDTAALTWADGYRRTPEYRTQEEMHKDFGALYLPEETAVRA
ncbi:Mu transposase C-terminal domain-containing protein [Pararhodospirillum photometricum]|uniref:Phage transposase protein A, putative n=1 Tax=Pararhodospirillum photometricum DSM 122 TaxID=1150469 RepID=H6SQL8_PARPM|nr:Mu transposase C-terminal domain-containing protein [Pararhodospirillum photometricum]CCG07333.1 Phage transposase protein A, putative [Pararhodospirillum photometricum DSM 122]